MLPCPTPHRPQRARLTHWVPHATVPLNGHKSACSAIHCCFVNVFVNLCILSIVSHQCSVNTTPRFPRTGPDGRGSSPSSVLSGRCDCLHLIPSAYCFTFRYHLLVCPLRVVAVGNALPRSPRTDPCVHVNAHGSYLRCLTVNR